ncbi:hypothetical protein JT358_15605 [Micrococcales bacterium 31B]|nr:hypothetical protein [Micrococcales bacterium 31B]
MVPLLVLVAVTLLARLVGLAVAPLADLVNCLAIGVAAMFLFTASARLNPARRTAMEWMVPPHLPRPGLLVAISGVAEAAGAVGVLIPQTRTLAGVALAVLLLAVFPANVYAARAPARPGLRVTPLSQRTALQVVFVAACLVVAWA